MSYAMEQTSRLQHEPFRVLPPDNDAPPSMLHRLVPFPLLFVPWLVMYEWVVYRGPLPGALQSYLPDEVHWPIWQWAEVLYFSPYVLVTLAPLLAATNRTLRRFIVGGALASVLVFLIFLTVPVIAPPRPFHPTGFLGRMMVVERKLDLNNGTAALPSFHVVWVFLGAAVFAARWPRAQVAWWLWAALVAASCVWTGMHSVLDVVAGFMVFLLVDNYLLFADGFRRVRDRVARMPHPDFASRLNGLIASGER